MDAWVQWENSFQMGNFDDSISYSSHYGRVRAIYTVNLGRRNVSRSESYNDMSVSKIKIGIMLRSRVSR